MAQAAANQLDLTEVRWIVTGHPVHKPAIASANDRLEMTRAALFDLQDPRMVVDDREVRIASSGKTTPSFQTVQSFLADDPRRELVWILGEDQWRSFTSWLEWKWLTKVLTFAVCKRPGSEACAWNQELMSLSPNVIYVDFEPDSISSTEIRQCIHAGQPITRGVISPSVEKYILTNKIYA